MNENASKLLSGIELFSELNEKELKDVAGLAQVRSIPRDTTIFHEGDTSAIPAIRGREESVQEQDR